MAPPDDPAGERAEFVRDGFSVVAFVVPFIWLAWHRLWLEAAFVFGVAIGLALLGEAYPWARAFSPLATLLGLYVALEGGALRVAALKRRGWREAGVVTASSSGEAELRWFADARQTGRPAPVADAPAPLPPAPVHPVALAGPALGLFSYPGNG
jgi:hypothetical protein